MFNVHVGRGQQSLIRHSQEIYDPAEILSLNEFIKETKSPEDLAKEEAEVAALGSADAKAAGPKGKKHRRKPAAKKDVKICRRMQRKCSDEHKYRQSYMVMNGEGFNLLSLLSWGTQIDVVKLSLPRATSS